VSNDQNLPPSMPAHWPFAPAPAQPQKPRQGFSTLGVIAIAVGIGIVAGYVLDAHGHTCDCGNKWWHLGALNVNNVPGHTCSRCGATQWWKNGVPDEVRQAHDLFGHNH
jgi:hypothetical protein